MPKVDKRVAQGPLQEAVCMTVDDSQPSTSAPAAPQFPPVSAAQERGSRKVELRRVSERFQSFCESSFSTLVMHTPLSCVQVAVPQHRMTPLKANWMSLYEPITQNMKLDMRMNLKSKKVSLQP